MYKFHFTFRIRKFICHLDDATNIIPGRERTEIEDEQPTEAGKLREADGPLVVIEDEHGLKSMYCTLFF